jgi:Uma2 family endonuclease
VSQVRRPTSTTRRKPEPVPLLVTARSGLRVSKQAFWRLCRDNPDLRLERSARGELIVMAPAGAETGHRNAGLTAQLWNWSRRNGSGLSFDSSTGFTLPNGAIRSPDASWIVRERWEALSTEAREKFAPICPDFVVELRSPSDDLTKLRDKMREYLDQGARLAWMLDPRTSEVEVYRPGRAVETIKRPMTLAGEDVLPAFVLDLQGILFD